MRANDRSMSGVTGNHEQKAKNAINRAGMLTMPKSHLYATCRAAGRVTVGV